MGAAPGEVAGGRVVEGAGEEGGAMVEGARHEPSLYGSQEESSVDRGEGARDGPGGEARDGLEGDRGEVKLSKAATMVGGQARSARAVERKVAGFFLAFSLYHCHHPPHRQDPAPSPLAPPDFAPAPHARHCPSPHPRLGFIHPHCLCRHYLLDGYHPAYHHRPILLRPCQHPPP